MCLLLFIGLISDSKEWKRTSIKCQRENIILCGFQSSREKNNVKTAIRQLTGVGRVFSQSILLVRCMYSLSDL